jgi:hypothetical protein
MTKISGRRKAKKESARTKQIKIIFGVVSGTILFLLFLLYKYDPLVPLGRETGSTMTVFNTQTRYGSGTYYVIELDSGEKVKVNASRMGPYKKGRRIVVEKMESRIFHKNVYRFIEYKDGV